MNKAKEKTEHTRAVILSAAYNLFTTKGLESCTVRDIVKASGLSQGTFYNYFRTKEELFDELVESVIAEIKIAVATARKNAKTPRDFVRDSYVAALEKIESEPKSIQLIARNSNRFRAAYGKSKKFSELFQDLNGDLKKRIAEGTFPRFNTRWMALTMMSTSIEVIFDAVERKEFDVESIADFLSRLFVPQLSAR